MRDFLLWCLLGVFVFLLSFLSFNVSMGNAPGIFFNADAYYFAMIYQDLFIDGFPLDGWSLATAPCFFPEMPIYFLLSFVTDNIIALYLWSAVWTFLWALMASFLCAFVTRKSVMSVFPFFLIVSSILLYVGSLESEQFLKWLYSFVHPHGSALMALLSLLILYQYLEVKSWKTLLLLCGAVVVSVASDKLFVPLFVAPAICVILLQVFSKSYRSTVFLILVLVCSAYLSLRGMEEMRGWKWFYFADVKIKAEYLSFEYKVWAHALLQGLWLGLSFPGKLIIFLSASMSLLYAGFALRDFPKALSCQKHDFMLYTIVFIWVSTLCVIVASGIIGMIIYKEPVQFRYLSGVYTFHLFLLGLFYLKFTSLFSFLSHKIRYVKFVFVITCVVVFLLLPLKEVVMGNVNFSKYHDKLATCLDENKEKYDLRHGISDYWNAKTVTLFSKKGIRVNQVTAGLDLYHWVNNIWWYRGKSIDYNFIITERLDLPIIIKFFGYPSETFVCDSRQIFVYSKPNFSLDRFLDARKIIFWRELMGR